jgi:metallo-beta-lactamase family protein
VILSASGMCEAGRIRHHLKHNLWRPESIILFVGYQAEHSLGRKLQDGAKSVKLFGEEIAVNAQIASLHGTSGHADQEGLLNWLQGFEHKPRTVFVNHGDDGSVQEFQRILQERGYSVEAPYSGTEYDLITGRMTAYSEGKRIDRVQAFKGSQRAKAVYDDLVAAAEELLALVKTRKGRTNKDNAKLTSAIRSLIEKWRN